MASDRVDASRAGSPPGHVRRKTTKRSARPHAQTPDTPHPPLGFTRGDQTRRARRLGRVIGRVNAWWGGGTWPRCCRGSSSSTSRGRATWWTTDGQLAAFLIGFLSQTEPGESYVHFVGVAPEHRGEGLGRRLYERFFEDARAQQRTQVRCVTSPANDASVAFHKALGFEVERVARDYDGPGRIRAVRQAPRVAEAAPAAGRPRDRRSTRDALPPARRRRPRASCVEARRGSARSTPRKRRGRPAGSCPV